MTSATPLPYDGPMETFTGKQQKDMRVLVDFVKIYCHARHDRSLRAPFDLPPELRQRYPKGVELCPDCAGLLSHGFEKRRKCPLDPKPSCKHCRVHCYSKEYRAKIREVMGFAGRRMIMRGRLDYLCHYFF